MARSTICAPQYAQTAFLRIHFSWLR